MNNHTYPGVVEKDVYYKPEESEPKLKESIAERTKLRRQKRPKYTVNEFNKLIAEKENSMELFQKRLKFLGPSLILWTLNDLHDKERNNELVNMFKSGLSDLKGKIEKTSEDEIKIERSNEIVDIAEIIFEFNRQNQEGQGLKI